MAAHGASSLGDRMVAVALAFAVLEVGGSAASVGLVLACGAVPLVGSLLIAGVVADRRSRRSLMVAADLVRVASQGTTAALVIAGVAEVWTLGVLAGVTGAATGFFGPASTALLPAVVRPEQLQPANGLRATAASAGEIAGPLAAGVIVATAGAGWALAADAATFALSAALLAGMRVSERVAPVATTFAAQLRDGWGELRARRWAWSLVGWVAVTNLLWASWSALGPVVADRDLGGAAAWGSVLAALGVGALAGGLAATRARPRRPLAVVGASGAVFALPLAALAASLPVAPLALAALLAGAALMIGNSLWESTMQRHIPGEALARVSAYDWFGSLAAYAIGLALWGPVASAIGIDAALWAASALTVVAAAAVVAVPDVRRLPAAPAAAPPGAAGGTRTHKPAGGSRV